MSSNKRLIRCFFWALASLSVATFETTVYSQETRLVVDLTTEESRQATTHGLNWLASRQRDDGSFARSPEGKGDTGVTALCGFAFLSSGSVPDVGPYSSNVTRCVDFILASSRPSGFITGADESAHGPMYGHGFSTMFLAEVHGMADRDDVRPALKRAVELIVASQNSQGGWRYQPVPEDADLTVTVCVLMALQAARNAGVAVPQNTIDRAVQYIRECQNPDGGFRYRLFDPAESKRARTAAAIVALRSATSSKHPAIQRGLEYLGATPGREPDNQYLDYFLYHSVQLHYHLLLDAWPATFSEIREETLSRQVDHHWSHTTLGDDYATAMALIVLQFPNHFVPIFE